MATTNLSIVELVSGQAQQDVTVNEALEALDVAICATTSVASANAGVTLTAAQVRGAQRIALTSGATAAFNVVLPAVNRLLMVSNGTSYAASVKCGSDATTITVDANTSAVIYCDATTVHSAPSYPREAVPIVVGDETTAITTGTAKVTFRMPYAFTLTAVRASLTTAQASGSIFTVDVNEAGTSVLSTKLTIDNTERTSTTAATPAVISDASIADDAEITVDVDQVGDGTAAGLKVWLIGRRA